VGATERELIVLSDLHLGRGRNPETRRYHSLEAFFYDDDFLRFARWLCADAARRGAALTVVLNGDTFDLLRIEPEDDPSQPPLERRYGPPLTPALAARTVAQILAGHPVFVRGLAALLRAGHHLVMLPGNHDLELQWAPVQAEVRRVLHAALLELDADADVALAGLRIEPWFYHEPGRVWIEHGCQYDPENAFRFHLRGEPAGQDAAREAELDMPLGNFFQKYLYNGFGHVTFIVPTSRANARYLRWLLVNQPRLLASVLWSHLPFVVQVLRRLARGATMPTARGWLRVNHEVQLGHLARESGLGDRLTAIDALKEAGADVLQATRGIGWQMLVGAGIFMLLALSGLGLWFVGLLAINALHAGFIAKSIAFMGLNLFLLLSALGGLGYGVLRSPRGVPSRPVQRAAQKLVDLLDVGTVVFGHTHEEVVGRLDRPGGEKAWYYNTGTWIAVFTHDVLLPRERVQYTFLRLRGREPELLHWTPGRGEPSQVILQDETSIDGFGAAPATVAPPAPKTVDAAAQRSR
jgi:UDP-2,3-diacylglucosamine pyrophosphatase LpxH